MSYKCPDCGNYEDSASSFESHMSWKHGRRFVNADNYRAPSYDLTPSGRQESVSNRNYNDESFGWGSAASLVDAFSSGSTDYGSSSDWAGGGGDSGGGGASGDW